MEEEKKTYLKEYGTAVCPICEKEFKKICYNSVYCSKECKKANDRKKHVDYARRRYAGDPEFRKKICDYKKKYYAKTKLNNA